MNQLPNFSAISRFRESPLSERVSLFVGGPETTSVATGILSCDSRNAEDGVVLLDSSGAEPVLKQVDWMLSDETEYGIEFIGLSEDKLKMQIRINVSQELE